MRGRSCIGQSGAALLRRRRACRAKMGHDGDPVNRVDPLGLETRLGIRLAVGIVFDSWGVQFSGVSLVGSVEQDLGDYLRGRVDIGCRVYGGRVPGVSREPELYGSFEGRGRGGRMDVGFASGG